MQGEIHVELNSELPFLQEVNDFLLNLKLAKPLTERAVFGLRQALMEMGQNAIEWGNQHRSEALVAITYRIHADHVEIVVRDQGKGSTPRTWPTPRRRTTRSRTWMSARSSGSAKGALA